MKSKTIEPKLLRLVDANLNRLKEGIRVIEDINRYLFDNDALCKRLKTLRHEIGAVYDFRFLRFRDIVNDVAKESIESERRREDVESLLLANYKRAQEAARVLEESFKLVEPERAELFKRVRYELYDLEKENFAA